MDAALSALGAFGIKLGITANNIANVNTDGFKKSRATLKDTDPSGVTVSISRVETPGSPIPSEEGTPQMRESSNVDLGEEIINLKTTRYAYLANLKIIEAEDARLGTLFDSMA
jgi:flagellar basal-body rod protein FlgC